MIDQSHINIIRDRNSVKNPIYYEEGSGL